MGLDLGKLELSVVRVHGMDLLTAGCAQDLDDLHQLVHPTLTCTQSSFQACPFFLSH